MWALGFLRRRRGRVALTVMGVALAVALTTTMLSISAGLDVTSRQVLGDTGVDLLVLDDGSPVFGAARHLQFANGTAIADQIEGFSVGGGQPVLTAFPVFERTVTLFPAGYPSCAGACVPVNALGNGEDPSRRGSLGGLEFPSGAYLDESVGDPFASDPLYLGHVYPGGFDSPNYTAEIVLNRVVARELEAGVGDTVRVAPARDFNESRPFRVVGVYEAPFETDQSRDVRLRRSELLYLAERTHDEATLIALDLGDRGAAPAVAALVEAAHPGLRAAAPEEILGELDRTTATFKLFAGIIALVSIAVAVLFASTVFMISARERVAEIAALRAIGISRATILKEMLLESSVLGGAGFMAGVSAGAALAFAVDAVLKATTTRVPHGMDVAAVTPSVVLAVGATSVLIGIAAGLVPALWATRVTIASAIRDL
jgi:ABC-type lipoprotein release transport system permease subunit